MRAHTEVDDTVWSFVKIVLQFLLQSSYLRTLFFEYYEKTSCIVLQICVVSFSYAYILKEILNTISYRNFIARMSFVPRITQRSQISLIQTLI